MTWSVISCWTSSSSSLAAPVVDYNQDQTCRFEYGVIARDAKFLAIFIPRGFGESGNGNLSFLGDQGNENLFLGFGSGFMVISGGILFQI